MTNAQGAYRVVVVNAGISDPSSTKLLADRIERGVAKLAATRGRDVVSTHIDLRLLLSELPAALGSQSFGPQFERAIAALRDADGIIAAAPVYKAGPSGLFTSFFQTLDNDLLIAKPVVLAATAGTARHALVVDEQMRSMFAYLRSMTVPTSLFASTEDWQDSGLGSRIERASVELLALMEAGIEQTIRGDNWGGYQHELGSAGGTELGIELSSDLMRMAAGGGAA